MMKNFNLLILLLFSLGSFGQSLQEANKLYDEGSYEEALNAITNLIKQGPTKESLLLRGKIRMELEDYYGAIGDFNNASEIDTTFAEAYNSMGLAKFYLGDDFGSI